MGWFDWLTGGSKVAEKAVDGIYNGLDALVYTDEEKSAAGQKILDWKLKYLESTKPQNVARRIIAFVVTCLWAGLILLAIIAKGFEADLFAQFIFETMRENVNTPFSIIIGFYFAAHVVRGWKGE